MYQENFHYFIWRIKHMPEVHFADDLDRTRSCLRNGMKAVIVSLLFWLVMGILCYRVLNIIGGLV